MGRTDRVGGRLRVARLVRDRGDYDPAISLAALAGMGAAVAIAVWVWREFGIFWWDGRRRRRTEEGTTAKEGRDHLLGERHAVSWSGHTEEFVDAANWMSVIPAGTSVVTCSCGFDSGVIADGDVRKTVVQHLSNFSPTSGVPGP